MTQNRGKHKDMLDNTIQNGHVGQYNTNNLTHKKEVRFQGGGTHQRT